MKKTTKISFFERYACYKPFDGEVVAIDFDTAKRLIATLNREYPQATFKAEVEFLSFDDNKYSWSSFVWTVDE